MLANICFLIIILLINCNKETNSIKNKIIKIGLQAPITGPQASEGQGILNFVKLIIEEKNKNKGILGKKLKIIVCDDEGKTQKSVVCAKRLVNEKVFAVIGSYSSGVTEASQKIYFKANILQTSVSSNDSLVRKGYWNFFRSSFPNSSQGEFTANYLVNIKKYKKIAIISNYSSYSTSLAKNTIEKINQLKGNIIFKGKIKSKNQDFASIITKLKSLKPDILYFTGYYTEGSYLRRQQIKLGLNCDFIGSDALYNRDFIKLSGKYAQGTYIIQIPQPKDLKYPDSKKYITMYKNKYKELPPSVFSIASADGLRVILKAIEKIKEFDTKKVSSYLINNLRNFKGITGKILFNKYGERIGLNFWVYKIDKNNKLKIFYNKT